MEKLTIDQMENLVGGRDCFLQAVSVEQAWGRYQNNPSEFTMALWVVAWANLVNCAQA